MANLKELSNTIPILTHEHTLEPLWGSDTGRQSNNGTYSGTFIGYFSQLVIEFGKTTQEQMTEIKKQFEKPTMYITYLDSNTGTWKTEEFYGTAIKAKKDEWSSKYKSFSITLTAIEEYEG